jgi:hypothetical protein
MVRYLTTNGFRNFMPDRCGSLKFDADVQSALEPLSAGESALFRQT